MGIMLICYQNIHHTKYHTLGPTVCLFIFTHINKNYITHTYFTGLIFKSLHALIGITTHIHTGTHNLQIVTNIDHTSIGASSAGFRNRDLLLFDAIPEACKLLESWDTDVFRKQAAPPVNQQLTGGTYYAQHTYWKLERMQEK